MVVAVRDDGDFNKGAGGGWRDVTKSQVMQVKPKDRERRWGSPFSFLASSAWRMCMFSTEMR